MSNPVTENNGINAVIKYEADQGRRCVNRVHKYGYDLISKGDNGEERHIEVKATSKTAFSSRWLEQLEYDAMKHDDKWFLYLVTDANGSARVIVYDRTKAENRFAKIIYNYKLVFPKSDFK